MEQWLELRQQIAFPIVVSFYLLHPLETKLEAIHHALVSLNVK